MKMTGDGAMRLYRRLLLPQPTPAAKALGKFQGKVLQHRGNTHRTAPTAEARAARSQKGAMRTSRRSVPHISELLSCGNLVCVMWEIYFVPFRWLTSPV